jgi:thiol:disulfide interchange protein DsbC
MKNFILISICLTFILIACQDVNGLEQEKGSGSQCPQLTNTEAENLLKEAIPDVQILEINQSPVKGLWEVALQSKGKKGLYYIDCSKKLLVAGAIIEIATKENLTRAKLATLNKVDVSKIPLEDALLMGDANAKTRVIVFTDPDCPYCAKIHYEMKKVIEKRKDIAFLIKMFPLKMHPDAYDKSKTIVCEKSLELLEDAFAKKTIPEPTCDTKAVDETIALVGTLGISGTPALVLPNGIINSGYRDADALIALIDKES